MPANEVIPFYEVADRITVHASVALTGRRFVTVTGREAGGSPGLSSSGVGGHYIAAKPAAGAACFGVLMWDVALGQDGPVIKQGIVPVEVGATPVVAGTEVQVDVEGRVIPLAAGRPVGFCCQGAAAAGFAEIEIY